VLSEDEEDNGMVNKWFWVLPAALLIAGIVSLVVHLWFPSTARTAEYPVCAGAPAYDLTSGDRKMVVVPLRQNCWSGWVKVPEHTKTRVRNPGKLAILPWSGGEMDFAPDDTEWIGKVAFANFRLRGDGEAKVSVD
jgi:hypothetical protein